MSTDALAPWSIVPNERLGKYRLIRELGRGGMGVVYLAEDTGLGREVAVKLIHPSFTMRPEYLALFRREARVVAGLAHPNIIRLHAFDEIGGRLCIESEYISGGSMADRLIRRGLTPAETAAVAGDVLGALAACHEAGVVHRDVKPTNVLLRERGEALLTDFGIARAFSAAMEDTVSGLHSGSVFLGTPRYAAPESWDGGQPSPTWDIYSTGVMLYEALAGRPLYDARSPMELVRQLAAGKSHSLEDLVPGVSPAFCALVESMVSLEPSARPASAKNAWDQLADTPEFREGAGVSPDSVTLRFSGVGRRRWRNPLRPLRAGFRIKAYHVAFAVVLLILAMGVAWRSPRVMPNPEAVQADAAAGRLLIADALTTSVPDVKALPNLPRSPDALALDVFDHKSGGVASGAALFIPSASGSRSGSLVVRSPQQLEFHTLAERGGAVSVSGGWGAYRGPQSTVFLTGDVSGQGRWLASGTSFTAELQYTTLANNSREARVLTFEPASDYGTDTAYLLALEADPYIQPLLYRELMPRQVRWAQNMEALLPALPVGREYLPVVSESRYSVTVDGRADELVWSIPRESAGGWLAILDGTPRDSGAVMRITRREEGVFVSVDSPDVADDAWSLRVNLLYEWQMPQSQSLALRVRVPPNGVAVAERREHGFYQPEDSPIEAARYKGTIEFRVPYPLIAGDPSTALRLRLNARAEREGASDTNHVLAVWGHPTLDAVEHGIILELRRRNS